MTIIGVMCQIEQLWQIGQPNDDVHDASLHGDGKLCHRNRHFCESEEGQSETEKVQ